MNLELFANLKITDDFYNNKKYRTVGTMYFVQFNCWLCTNFSVIEKEYFISPTLCNLKVAYSVNEDNSPELKYVRIYNEKQKNWDNVSFNKTFAFNGEATCREYFRKICKKHMIALENEYNVIRDIVKSYSEANSERLEHLDK